MCLFLKDQDNDDPLGISKKGTSDIKGSDSATDLPTKDDNLEKRHLTTIERLKRDDMEKAAGWWNKYYASKAKLVRNYYIFIYIFIFIY